MLLKIKAEISIIQLMLFNNNFVPILKISHHFVIDKNEMVRLNFSFFERGATHVRVCKEKDKS